MASNAREHIADWFRRRVRTFINELIEGTNDYRQLYALSEQFPHDYHDRFLVELIQNANDASQGGEVRIVFDEAGRYGPPTLYVANQGLPFTPKNFEAICSLGLSDKDPNEAIGNKGLGFRSVLQICRSPQIYSAYDGDALDGYCFELGPGAREVVVALIDEALEIPASGKGAGAVMERHFGEGQPLFTEPSRIEGLRVRLEDGGCNLSEEVQYLSPYSLPLPLQDAGPIIQTLQGEAFVTVIELALETEEDVSAVRRALRAVAAEYLLFTPKLSKIIVEHLPPPETQEDLSLSVEKLPVKRKHPNCPPEPLQGIEIWITRGGPPEQRVWWLHSGSVQGKELEPALRTLPKIWQGVTQARVTVALERSEEEPPEGWYSIYLPTQQRTGSPVSVNGPFYGNLARTNIDFGITYNRLLLGRATELIVEMLDTIRSSDPTKVATAVVDVLDSRDQSAELVQLLDQRLEDRATPLRELPAIALEGEDAKARQRVVPIAHVRSSPEGESPHALLTPARLASVGASLPAHALREHRASALARLAQRAGVDLKPSIAELADWIEALADQLLRSQATIQEWNQFYQEVAELAKASIALRVELRRRRFLLTDDNRLVASDGDWPRLFAFPVRGGSSSEEDRDSEADSTERRDPRADIPSHISPRVAFLHHGTNLFEEGPGRRTFDSVGQMLRIGSPPLVRDFETRSLVNEVVVPLVAETAASSPPFGGEVYSQALQWSSYLYLQARSEGASPDAQWDRLCVPTKAGWQFATEAYFGAGWTGTQGDLMAQAFPSGSPFATRFLLPPDRFAQALSMANWPEAELQTWVEFLRDRLGVEETPRVRQVMFRRNRPVQEYACLKMAGMDETYFTSELGNIFEFPEEGWETYLSYLRDTLRPPIRGYETYYLNQQATLDGLTTVNAETAIPYAVLVANGFKKLKGAMRTGVSRSATNVYQPQGTVDTSLAFALKRLPWLPYVQGEDDAVQGLAAPDQIWYVPPDSLEFSTGRIRYSFLAHVPRLVARAVTDEFREAVSLPSVQVTSAEEGITLLGDLARAWKKDIPSERLTAFLDLWRDTLLQTSLLYIEVSTHDLEGLRTRAQERGLDGLLILPAGRRAPEWRVLLPPAENEIPTAYLPDDPALRSSLGPWVDQVDMRNAHVEAQVQFIQDLFGPQLRRLSQLELVPEPGDGESLEPYLEPAPLLKARVPWLEAFALAVFALGRQHDMNPAGNEFRLVSTRFRRLRYAEVPGLQLRLRGLDRDAPPLHVPSFFSEEHQAILVRQNETTTGEDLVNALRTFFEVQDIEIPLGRALAKLPWNTNAEQSPTDEEQMAALEALHIDVSDFNRVKSSLAAGNSEWMLERLVLVVSSVQKVATPEEGARLRNLLLDLAREDSLPGALARADQVGLFLDRPQQIAQLVMECTGDDDLAGKVWRSHGVSLEIWNQAARALGSPYRPCVNDGVHDDFTVAHRELRPVVMALLRQALTTEGLQGTYVGAKQAYESLEPPSSWKEQFWELPFAVVIAFMQTWIAAHLSLEVKKLDTVLSLEACNVAEVARRAAEAGLELDHNDDETEQRNRDTIGGLMDAILKRLLAVWLMGGREGAPIPNAVVEASQSDRLLSQESVRSVCQVSLIPEAEALGTVLDHFLALKVFDQLGIENRPWTSLSSLVGDLPADDSALELAAERLANLQEFNQRRARTRQVLGNDYEMPRGDTFNGLGDLIDTRLDPTTIRDVDPFQMSPLSGPPARRSRTRGSGTSRGRRVSTRDQDLVGAVGEYLIYKVLCTRLGTAAAAESWQSGNRRHFLPEPGDDTLGYDFEVISDGVIWQIEVKSSTAKPQFVDLSENEVDRARSAQRRGSRTRYLVLLVANVLSQPEFLPLGNPYAPGDRGKFRLEEGGARVYFRLVQ
jgi:hypothetical protein